MVIFGYIAAYDWFFKSIFGNEAIYPIATSTLNNSIVADSMPLMSEFYLFYLLVPTMSDYDFVHVTDLKKKLRLTSFYRSFLKDYRNQTTIVYRYLQFYNY